MNTHTRTHTYTRAHTCIYKLYLKLLPISINTLLHNNKVCNKNEDSSYSAAVIDLDPPFI